MHSTERAPLEDLLAELDVNNERAPSNGGHRQKQRRPYRSPGEDFHFRSDKPLRTDKRPMSKRVARSVALFLFAVLVGVGGTLASQSYRDEIIQVFPPLDWLWPVSTTMAPVPSVTTADLQEQFKPLAVDLALVRRSVEQLGSNLDQLAHKQDQLAQNMANTGDQSEGFSPAAATQGSFSPAATQASSRSATTTQIAATPRAITRTRGDTWTHTRATT
jgi:hypothetical protein